MFEPRIGRVDVGVMLGSAIRASRVRARWSERELARRLSTNQRAIQRLESGRQQHVDVRLASKAIELLGIRLAIDIDAPGLRTRTEQRDAVHAWCCSSILRRLRRLGWETRAEVEIGDGRSRGWIDVLAFRPSDGALMVIEVKTVIDDLGRIIRTLGWYTRSARQAAEELGWRPRRVVRVLVVLATTESESRLVMNESLVATEFPGDSRVLSRWLMDPAAPAPQSSIALIDPGSRRPSWLLRARSEGRRTPAPYRDYADAAAKLNSAPLRSR